jgi:hypothetical protein
MRAGSIALLVFSIALGACASGSRGDAAVDAPGLQTQNFDVDNSGTAACPGSLFGVASEGRATCSRTPQRCTLQGTSSGTQITCTCDSATDGGSGSWICREGP